MFIELCFLNMLV
jgi:hypothetical protein